MSSETLDRDVSVVELLKKKIEQREKIDKDFLLSFLPTVANFYNR